MHKNFVKAFGSEWFGVSIGTLALAEVYLLAYGQFKFAALNLAGEFFSFLGIAIFAAVLILWIIHNLSTGDKVSSHWHNLTRLSFVSLIPIICFVGNYQLIQFFGLNGTAAAISLANYTLSYMLSLILGVLLGYRLYTKEITPREINYAVVIPPLAIGTSVFLGGDLINYYGGTTGHTIYFLLVFGLGIFFFLYIFIGSLALAGHVSNKNHDLLPTTMLPVGIASLIVINILSLVEFNGLGIFYLSPSAAGMISVMLWGFEVWNFLVVAIIIFTKPIRKSISVWAYGFPLGLFAVSTLKIMAIGHENVLIWVFVAIAVSLNVVWIYAWMNTISFIVDRYRKTEKAGTKKTEHDAGELR
ncbi:MAG: C4-dicarboxylate ABC transporter [Thermoplasmataceae archaeon]